MSITTEIQRLRTNVNKIRQDTSDILEAIANKGVTVPAGSSLDDCAGLVSQITGTGAVLPDINLINGSFKNFFPLDIHTSNPIFNNALVYNSGAAEYSLPYTVPITFSPTNDDDFEIVLKFMKPSSYTSNNRCLIGGSSYYKSISIELGSNVSNSFVWCGIPQNGTQWQNYLTIPSSSISLSANTWYFAKLTKVSDTITLSILNDSGTVLATVSGTGYNLYSGQCKLTLGNCNYASDLKWNGYIDFKESYIKLNDSVLWGVQP